MITAPQIRIGNYFNCHGMRIEVAAVHEDYVLDKIEDGEFEIPDLIPIELNESWMNGSFKFKLDDNTPRFYSKEYEDTNGVWTELEVMFTTVGYWIIINQDYSGKGDRKRLNIGHFEYVHTLQNIYLDLTLEQLTK